MNIRKCIACGLGLVALGVMVSRAATSDAANCDGNMQTTWAQTSTCPNSFNPDGISQGFFDAPTGRRLTATKSTSVEPTARARGFNAQGTLRCTVSDITNNGDTNGESINCNSDSSQHFIQVF